MVGWDCNCRGSPVIRKKHLVNATSGGPGPETAGELLARQAALQSQVGEVIADLDLMSLLTVVGHPVQVGSAVTGLMVWRDIDLQVLCDGPSIDPQRAHAALSPLASHANVKRLIFHNHSGPFRVPNRPDGLYYGIHYLEGGTSTGDRWNCDCWFLLSHVPRPEFALIDRIRRDLKDETRLAILWIKDTWYHNPSYRHTVHSVDIYTAVLDHGIRTPDQFAAWLRRRRSE